MTIDTFIPDIWSARLLENLHKSLVYGQTGVINRDYEGEIRNVGDSVKIHNLGAISVSAYTKNSDMSAPSALTDAETILAIDQAYYFNFQIDDIDKVQQTPKVMNGAMAEAAYSLANTADAYIAALYAGIDSGNWIGDDDSPKADLDNAHAAYEYLLDLSVLLDEANVPTMGRWAIVPPWFYGLLLKDDQFVATGSAASDARLTNGLVGEAAGMTIYKSNNVPNTGSAKYKIVAGYPGAWSYAEQINSVEAYRPELRFADAVKGLHLYGAKLVRSTGLAVLVANRPA